MSHKSPSLRSYIIGFVLSVCLTLVAFYVVANSSFSGWSLTYFIMLLAVIQLAIQLICFLHLRAEAEPRWNLLIFDFMLIVLVILVFGSLWIMQHLNYHTMSPTDTDTYLLEEEGIHKQ